MQEGAIVVGWIGLFLLALVAGIFAHFVNQRQLAEKHQALLRAGFRRVDVAGEAGGCLQFFNGGFTGGALSGRMLAELSGFGAFQIGDSRMIFNVYRRDEPIRRLYLFTYRYSTGSGKNRSTHQHEYLLVQSSLFLPSLEWRQEHFGDRVAGFFGVRDIQFESSEFNERFHVTAASPEYAFQVIHPQVMEQMLAHFRRSWAIQGRNALTGLEGVSPEAIENALWEIKTFFDAVPQFVRDQYSGPSIAQQSDFGELSLAERSTSKA